MHTSKVYSNQEEYPNMKQNDLIFSKNDASINQPNPKFQDLAIAPMHISELNTYSILKH